MVTNWVHSGGDVISNLGYQFEFYVTSFFRELFKQALERNPINKVFRVIGSGRNKLATITGGDVLLEGDVSIEVDTLPKHILIECKHRKSGAAKSKSFTIKKEWVDQALHESEKNGRWSLVAIKFKGVAPNSKELQQYCWADGKYGNTIHYVIPEKHFAEMLSCIESVKTSCINNRNNTLKDISDDELIEELKVRLIGEKKCLNDGKLSGEENS